MPDLIRFAAALGAGTETAEWVERTGKLFECGEWPDRRFTFSEADADAAIAGFTPVPIELEHFTSAGQPHLLAGHMGSVERLWRDGKTLLATVRIPAWFDALWGAAGHKISAAWHPTEKRLQLAGAVLDPGIADAVLFSAFAGRRHSAADTADMQLIHDATVRQGAACTPTALYAAPKEKTPMSFIDQIKAWLDKGAPTDYEPTDAPASPPPAPAPVAAPAPDAAFTALQARLATVEAERETERAAARQAQAVTFADAQITGHKALPAERDTLIALYVAAATDDAASPRVVTFGAGGTQSGSRVDALTALYAARPAHTLTQPALETTVFSAGTAEKTKAEPTPDELETRRKALLARTELGRATLKEKGH